MFPLQAPFRLVGGDWNIRKVGLLTYQNGCFMGFNGWLVVWNMNGLFLHILGITIPTTELIFFRGVAQPPTSRYMNCDLQVAIVFLVGF